MQAHGARPTICDVELENGGHRAAINFVFHDVICQDKGQLEVRNSCHPVQKAHTLLMRSLDLWT